MKTTVTKEQDNLTAVKDYFDTSFKNSQELYYYIQGEVTAEIIGTYTNTSYLPSISIMHRLYKYKGWFYEAILVNGVCVSCGLCESQKLLNEYFNKESEGVTDAN